MPAPEQSPRASVAYQALLYVSQTAQELLACAEGDDESARGNTLVKIFPALSQDRRRRRTRRGVNASSDAAVTMTRSVAVTHSTWATTAVTVAILRPRAL